MTLTQRTVIYLILALSLVGILDAGFLVYKHYTGGSLPCTLFDGCDEVTRSSYAKILGVPIAWFGFAYYVFVFASSLAVLDRQRPDWMGWLVYPAAGAFLFSGYLVYVQAAILSAFCAYCLLSAANSTVIFIAIAYLTIKIRSRTGTV